MNNFEKISPSKIIDYSNNNLKSKPLELKPSELYKSNYISGQTIILKGEKQKFDNLIRFWLSTQIWYGSDSADSFFEKLIFDNLKIYASWQNDPNRVGVCRLASKTEKDNLNSKVSNILKINKEYDFLIMVPRWDELKVLFMDEINYYLYHFWTGE
ncbi:hypothetical protein [uncultured Tenacibaculum sp.]|uniref:hypothetical protein n=1 Tax=uncultured Tenacibaculum sp. TaxID=174713 RepID=UPI002608C2AF|nr:hypothetical protein [uncultured Tenacibaculum sp.]